jgi:hypothetical protein
MRRLACMLIAALPWATAAESWLPVKDVSLMVVPGSILDLSTILPPAKPITSRLIVNSAGQLALSDAPEKSQRFLMATLPVDLATGSFPSHAMVDLYVRQLRLRGYNMARLHFVDSVLMHQRKNDFDYNPEQFDRFHYLLATLRREGIYYILDGLSSENGSYGEVKEQWVNEKDIKRRLFYDASAQAHWKKMTTRLLEAVNTYTGNSTVTDPALAGIILVNEGGLAFVMRKGEPVEIRALFSRWLAKRYGDETTLKKAWKDDLKAGESIASENIALPNPDGWTSARMSDGQKFYYELERATADWMARHLRKMGYQGLLTAYDNWLSPAAHASREQFSWVDLHNYHSEPTDFVAQGSVMRQDSMIASGAKYITELAAGRHIGKAFTVSEYGQVFWNQYRRETALALPTYASFQRWSMIAQHGSAFILSYAERGGRKDKIYPFMVGTDPIARAGETLAALLFLRGDVAPSVATLGVALSSTFVFEENAFLSNLPRDIAALALVTGIGLQWQGGAGDTRNYDAQIAPGNSNLITRPANSSIGQVDQSVTPLGTKIARAKLLTDELLASRVEQLRKANLLSPSNITAQPIGLFQTDTGQVVLDSRQKRLTVVTPNTEAVVFEKPSAISLHNLSVLQADGPTLVAISAMDNQILPNSLRMLLILATDARNTNMRFADAAETILTDLGTKPVVIRTTSVQLRLNTANAARLKVYSVNLRGERGDTIKVVRQDNSVSFKLDTSTLSHGPTTYFEIAE